ncbi:MAG: TlpA family protein disulfide reductase, partial [Acidimicrobiales bacterium]
APVAGQDAVDQARAARQAPQGAVEHHGTADHALGGRAGDADGLRSGDEQLACGQALLAARLGAPDPADADPLAGRLAPSLTGRTLTGDAFDLDTLRGRWVVVNFWASWCPPCWREHPELVEFERRHQAAGDARVVGVVFNDDPAAARAFMAERGGGWPVVLDEDGSRSVAYAVTKAPETILVAPSGVVVAKHKGEVSADLLDRLIADVSRRAEAGS